MSVPVPFLEKVDDYAKEHYLSRSALIRVALLEKLNLNNMLDLQQLNNSSSSDEEYVEFMRRLYGDDWVAERFGK